MDPSPQMLFPESIGRYELLVPIASGGMATVYLGRMRGIRGFEREVAVKVMHPHLRWQEDEGYGGADLIEEAKLAARIRHPNVVPVLDVGEDPQGVYLVMEYVEGTSLAAILRRAASEPVPVPIALRILCDAFAGLHAAHELRDSEGKELGLVHRDFSPQNILVGIDGVARLTDFGIAKAADREGLTRSGVVKGKAGYMSPEQARAQVVDRRSDVWAAGVVAWETFAGQRLFAQGDPVATALAIVTQRAPRLRSVVPDVPAEVDDAIAAALVRERERRLATVAELRDRLVAAWQTDLASRAEVAEHVTRLAGKSIAARRERVHALLDRRAVSSDSSESAEPQTGESGVSMPRARSTSRWIGLGMGALLAGGIAVAAMRGGSSAEPVAQEPARAEEPPPRPTEVVPTPVASTSASTTPSVTRVAPPRAPRRATTPSATPLGPNPYESP